MASARCRAASRRLECAVRERPVTTTYTSEAAARRQLGNWTWRLASPPSPPPGERGGGGATVPLEEQLDGANCAFRRRRRRAKLLTAWRLGPYSAPGAASDESGLTYCLITGRPRALALLFQRIVPSTLTLILHYSAPIVPVGHWLALRTASRSALSRFLGERGQKRSGPTQRRLQGRGGGRVRGREGRRAVNESASHTLTHSVDLAVALHV